MKALRLIVILVAAAGMLALSATTTAQNTDKEKLIQIEKTFAANENPGAHTAAIVKKYDYNGPLNGLNPFGQLARFQKAQVVKLSSAPDPSDPNAKAVVNESQFHVDIYGTTALVSYKATDTETGHKETALNRTYHMGCLDTFVKRNGAWYVIGGACDVDTPLSQAVWNAQKKALAQEPKEVKKGLR